MKSDCSASVKVCALLSFCSSGLTPDFDLVLAESAVQTVISLSHSVTVLLLKSSSLVVAVLTV